MAARTTARRDGLGLLRTEFNEQNAEISPDGNWLAYRSNASGQDEVYVRPFPDVDSGRWQVSTAGGVTPLWAPDGRDLFYLAPGGRMMAVSVQTDATFGAGNPEVLFEGNYFFEGPGGPLRVRGEVDLREAAERAGGPSTTHGVPKGTRYLA